MSILGSELKPYRSVVVSNLPANGGVMSSSEIVSGVSGNLFPNATQAERAAGAVHYRKMFYKVNNASDLTLLNSRLWQDTNTVGDDKIVFSPSTQRGTQADVSPGDSLYGVGVLNASVSGGATSLGVLVEDGAVIIFRNGELIRITDRATPYSAGNEQWVRIVGTPTVSGNLVTMTIDTPLAVAYLSGASKVSSVYEYGDVAATRSAITVSSPLGTVSPVVDAEDITTTNVGTVEQTWTLTFVSPTAFNISGDLLGAIGSGNIASTTAPFNASMGDAYFRIDPAVFGGTFAGGDTVVFSTHPAAVPIMLRRTVPIGASPVSNNFAAIYIDGESE